MKRIMKCPSCNLYTMKTKCISCTTATNIPKPARYSPEDHYGEYRRKAKEADLRGRGLM